MVNTVNFLVTADVSEVSCEYIDEGKWNAFVETLTTCRMQQRTSISNPVSKIFTQDTTMEGLTFYENLKVEFLPLKVATSFPNLKGYSASKCSIKEIFKAHFRGLSKLQLLDLANNEIKKISSDTFEDSPELKHIWLCKENLFSCFTLAQLISSQGATKSNLLATTLSRI